MSPELAPSPPTPDPPDAAPSAVGIKSPIKKRRRRWLSRVIVAAVVLILAAGGSLYYYLCDTQPLENLPTWITRQPIAHRGLHDAPAAPENSLAAFQRAVDAGCPIELDVHLLADGQLAVMHDYCLKRMTGDPRQIEACSADQLAALRLAGSQQRIPLLADVLELVAGRVPLLLETKNSSRTDHRLEQALARTMSDYPGSWAVMSFNPYSLSWFRKHAPAVPRGQLACDYRNIKGESEVNLSAYQQFLLRNLLLTGYSQPAFIVYHADSMPNRVVALKRRHGLPVLVWTIRTPEQREQVRGLCDNVIFEGPPESAR